MNDFYLNFKKEVISHYSPEIKCIECGCDDIRCLTIYHSNGNGNKHRRKNGRTLKWLKKNNYPEGFQILCGNCNWKKERRKMKLQGDVLKCIDKEKMRFNVILHYSPTLECKNCGCKDYDALTIDHINGDGNTHRRSIGRKTIYKDIIDNKFPKAKYQILCMNCQLIKSDTENERVHL